MSENAYYLAFHLPKDKKRQQLVEVLQESGAIRVHYSLWQISKKSVKTVLFCLDGYQPIVLKQSRGITLPSSILSTGTTDLGTVSIFAYRCGKSSPYKHVILSRAL
jgi:hypothetical protein